MQSKHLTCTWTQTSFDTSHVQGLGLHSKQWSHLHHQHIRNWQGITIDLVLELMFIWEVLSIRNLLCLLFKLTSTTTIIKLMIGSYVTSLSQEWEWLWHFCLVIFYYLILKNRTLFILAVNQETSYFAFLLSLKRGLMVSMIIVTPLYNQAFPQILTSIIRILDISIICKSFLFCIFMSSCCFECSLWHTKRLDLHCSSCCVECSLILYRKIIMDNNTHQYNNTTIHQHDYTPMWQHN
jgi:hypothetical protein